MDLPGYDDWKLATPPEYEMEEEEIAPPAQPQRAIKKPQERCPNGVAEQEDDDVAF